MSLYSRDYMREDDPRRAAGGPSTWSVVTWLLVVNVAVHLVLHLFLGGRRYEFLALSLDGLEALRLWTPLTYQFVHANHLHLLANLLMLFFLGRMLLQFAPPRQVLAIYLLGGLAGGGLQLLWNGVVGPDAPIVGASGSVLALAMALVTLAPGRRVQLLLFFILPVNLTLRQIGWILIALNVLTLLFPGGGAAGQGRIAVMAHFGGMLWGWAHIRLGWHQRTPRRTAPPQRRRSPARAAGAGTDRKKAPFVTGDVDAILDKINERGFQSLTHEERQILEQSSRRLSRRLDGDA